MSAWGVLADVVAGKVDVILVYKIDRLTRSLADFAKIVEVLDSAGASFVSITQSFNTTTGMGFAARFGPQPALNPDVDAAISHAIKGPNLLRIRYVGR